MYVAVFYNYRNPNKSSRLLVRISNVYIISRRTIYRKLRDLHRKHACQIFLDNFELLERHCGYSEFNIPQLDDVNRFLKGRMIINVVCTHMTTLS